MRVALGSIIAVVILGVAVWALQSSSPAAELTEGTHPAYHLIFATYDGKEVSPADFAGTPVILNSWASWCTFCQRELSDFQAVKNEVGNAVELVAINRQESLSTALQYTDALEVTEAYHFWLDPSDSFYTIIGGFSMPETLFLNADGSLHFHKRGVMSEDEFRERVQELMSAHAI